MNTRTLTIITFLTILCQIIGAQNYDFGKVSKEEVMSSVYEKDTSASAVVLHKYRTTYFDYDSADGWIIATEVHERIKILNKDGLDYGTKKIGLYKSNSSKERLSGLKGYTYFNEGGKVKSEKLKRSASFKEEVSDNWDQISFTMPNVSVGSVVEWTYKITSPFWKIDDLIVQQDIPVKHYHSKIDQLSYFNFQRIVKGGLNVNPKEYKEPRSVNVSYEQNTSGALTQETRSAKISTIEYVHEYELQDIPALKMEPFVDNIDNYRFTITYELMSVQFPKSGLKQYSTSWEEVVKTINKSDNFGKQLDRTNFLKDDAAQIVSASNGEMEVMSNAFHHIKSKMTWNDSYGKYSRRGIQKAYKENIGDVSEINLMLVALLRECGLKAHPVLVSTRSHGIPLFPTLEGFNYVIACAEINGQEILMDATEKQSIPGLLPERVLNWEGTMVLNDDNFKKVRLYPETASRKDVLLSVEINDDGSIQGDQTISFSDMEALNYRNVNRGVNQNAYIEAIVNTYQFDDVTEFQVKNVSDLNESIKESFMFEVDEGVSVIGNEIYFSPLFFLSLNENPFKLEDRRYPINYTFPRAQRKIVNIKIPEGYKVSALPEPVRITFPGNLGSYLFNISEVAGGINVMTDFKINTAIIPSYGYPELKEFYNQRVLKETEKVVLTKL